jgi:5'-nucleotidase
MLRILLTNDDGIGAPGLHALEATVAGLGEVHVVAPLTEQSGTSRAITLRRPLRYETRGVRRYAVEGTPADTVMMAISQILGFQPDLAISGSGRRPTETAGGSGDYRAACASTAVSRSPSAIW